MERFDILGLGCTAVDDLVYLPHYPAEDSKMEVHGRQRHCGGLTATALVAAARLGARCAYAGSLGSDELSEFVKRRLAEEGVALEHLRHVPDARPVHSVILVNQARQSRTILYDLAGAGHAVHDWPPNEVVLAAKVLFVDFFGIAGMLRAARLAREAGIPVVADFEHRIEGHEFAELMELVDHLVVPAEFACQWTGRSDANDAAEALWTQRRAAVVVTCGDKGCWYVEQPPSAVLDNAPQPRAAVPHEPKAAVPTEARHQAAFHVQAVDTTGCGDVFHGAYAAGLAEGLPLVDRIRLASAAAAMKATRPGGQAGIPNRAAVETFLNEHSQ